ncbi:AMP-binding protein [Streptomyces sp. DSM 116496]|uniref:AMP-binding protein n=1 Tax=Streptomyces stoeckheimensis TaxID=3344656 RepID=UPI0038B2D641
MTSVPMNLWGGPATPNCLVESFLEVVSERPDAVAVVEGDTEFTYARLRDWAGAVAELLVAQGIGPEDRVAVTGPRGAAVVAAFLGTVAIGATYVPLDPEYPVQRLAHMLNDSAAKVLLYTGDEPGFETSATLVRIPEPGSVAADLQWRPVACRPDLPVYVIYTSGTTGWPKGVSIPHSCLDGMAAWQTAHSVRRDLRTAQFAPLNFDVCFQEVLGTLCGGGTLVIVPEKLRRDAFSLLDWLGENRIERLFLPYLALNMLAVAASAEDSLDHMALAEINTAGEQFVCTGPIREFFERLPACRLNNHYGQSESAMVTAHTLTGSPSTWPALPPIGTPLPGCELLIDPVDPAEPEVGELLVAGLPLSLGYLNQEQLNAERFVTIDPSPQGHTRAFRTGDLVRLDDGVLQFLSRRDHDVKIRGFRVNLLEVDVWLLEQSGVVEAACVAVETAEGSRTLRAVITVEEDAPPADTGELLRRLGEVLPAPAVPVSITVVEALPRTASGKIDRQRIGKDLLASSL